MFLFNHRSVARGNPYTIDLILENSVVREDHATLEIPNPFVLRCQSSHSASRASSRMDMSTSNSREDFVAARMTLVCRITDTMVTRVDSDMRWKRLKMARYKDQLRSDDPYQ